MHRRGPRTTGSLIRALARCVARGVHDTIWHDGIEHAGYLAFLGLLALFPFLVFVVAVLGTFSTDAQLVQLLASFFHRLPPEVWRALEPRIMEITSGPPQGLLTLAIVGAIWTASSAVEGLRTILNRAYHVHTPPRYLLRRSLSILQLFIFTCILIIGMSLLVMLPALVGSVDALLDWVDLPPVDETIWWSRMIYTASLATLFFVVGWIYYAVPNIRQSWISVWPGAFIVVILWLVAARLFVSYMGHFTQLTLIYGSLGGIIAALIFFYICNVIFIFGAEFNHHLGEWAGMDVVEKDHRQDPSVPANAALDREEAAATKQSETPPQ